jgi:hypothetical protein
MENDEFESRSLRSVDATGSDVKIHVRKGKKVLASSAQTLAEAEGKPLAKATAYATTLHVRPSVEVIGASMPIPVTVVTRG